jgi:hypothetical protein
MDGEQNHPCDQRYGRDCRGHPSPVLGERRMKPAWGYG